MFIHNIDPVAINFFNIEIRWYSLAYIAGILLGWFFSKRIIENLNSNNKLEKINPKIFDELIPYLVLGIIIGGRLGYVIIYNLEYYLKNLLNIFFIWEGGMSFHGGLIGIIIAVIIFCKKNNIKNIYHIRYNFYRCTYRNIFWKNSKFYKWRTLWEIN